MTMLRLSSSGTEEDAALAKESRSGGAVGTTASKSTEKEGKSTKRKKKSTSVTMLWFVGANFLFVVLHYQHSNVDILALHSNVIVTGGGR